MPDKEEIKRNFSRSAREYDRRALLQAEMADRLFFAVRGLKPDSILDIGCGTGYLALRLAEKFPSARVLGIDLAPGMIATAREKNRRHNLIFRVGDGEALRSGRHSFDLAVSNASLQWMEAERVFRGVRRVVRPGGRFVFTTFGPRTLRELKAAGFKVKDYISAGEIKALLKKEGFKTVCCGARVKKQKFESLPALLKYLKEIGARSRLAKKPGDGGGALKAYRRGKKPFYASFEVITGHFIAAFE